jgi:hypothetical protein
MKKIKGTIVGRDRNIIHVCADEAEDVDGAIYSAISGASVVICEVVCAESTDGLKVRSFSERSADKAAKAGILPFAGLPYRA